MPRPPSPANRQAGNGLVGEPQHLPAPRSVACRLLNDPCVMLKTILVVDDDPAVLKSYGLLLRRLGHRILLSEDPEGGRNDPQSLCGVDLLILDQRMPRTQGLALLASLRGREGGMPEAAGGPVPPAGLPSSA